MKRFCLTFGITIGICTLLYLIFQLTSFLPFDPGSAHPFSNGIILGALLCFTAFYFLGRGRQISREQAANLRQEEKIIINNIEIKDSPLRIRHRARIQREKQAEYDMPVSLAFAAAGVINIIAAISLV